jgi:hypothetical protein
MGPRNRFQGMNSTSLCSLAGRYDNPSPLRFLAPIDFLKIPALNLHKYIYRVHCHPPSIRSHRGTKVVSPDIQPMRVSEELVCVYLFKKKPVFTSHLRSPVHVGTASASVLHQLSMPLALFWSIHPVYCTALPQIPLCRRMVD